MAEAPTAETRTSEARELSLYAGDALGMTRSEFERAHPSCVLLVERAAFHCGPRSVSFETVAVPRVECDGPQGYLVFPVSKNEHNPWPERISLGRARNCDVVMRHASVSKLHAHFFLDQAELTFSDANSTNGCSLNERSLEAGKRVPISCGDHLTIGTLEATLYSPVGLFELIRELHVTDC